VGRITEAQPLYRQALEVFERRLGKQHPHTLVCREGLEALGGRL